MFGDASAMPATRGKDLDHPVAFLVPKTRIDPEGIASLGSVPTDLGVQAFARSLWRITRPEFSPIEALSATQLGGRWNSPGASMLYTAEDPLGALEELMMAVRGQRVIADFLPRHFVLHEIDVKGTVEYAPRELLRRESSSDFTATRAYGDLWLAMRRTSALAVPSILDPSRYNYLLNLADRNKLDITIKRRVMIDSPINSV